MTSNQGNYRPYIDRDTFNTGNPVVYKPGVGLINTETGNPLLALVLSSITKLSLKHGRGLVGIHAGGDTVVIEKNYILDLEFSEYFDANNMMELIKNLVWGLAKIWLKAVATQPLDIVRLVLQVGKFDKKPRDITSLTLFSVSEEDGHVDYFQLKNEWNDPPQPQPAKPAVAEYDEDPKEKLHPKSLTTLDLLSLMVSLEGPFAPFKGANTLFLYSAISTMIETWITGFLLPFLGVPDPYFLDLAHLNDPVRLLWLSVGASVVSGLILMPLDLIRVKFMITKFNRPQQQEKGYPNINTRSFRDCTRNYPVELLVHPPWSITILTSLNQFAGVIFRKAAPYFLFIRFNIDSFSNPNVSTFFNLLALLAEFFVKLPVENLLRKSQVRLLVTPKTTEEDPMRVVTIDDADENLVVDINDSWYTDDADTPLHKRISDLGLFNGWQVGAFNVISFWGLEILKDASVEIREERL